MDSPSTPPITAVILAFKQREKLLRVVEAVLQQSVAPNRVIVVDNHGCDGSAEAIRARFPTVDVLEQPENRGVGAGHNAGWRAAMADPTCEFIWALEHDCIPAPDCLAQLLHARRRLRQASSAPCIVSAASDDKEYAAKPTTWIYRHMRLLRLFYDHPTLPPQARPMFTFNATLLPTSLLRQVGDLNEQFFFYWEDAEYSARCRAVGATVYRIYAARIEHRGSYAMRQLTLAGRRLLLTYESSPFRIYYLFRNQIFIRQRKIPQRYKLLIWSLKAYLVAQVSDLLIFGPDLPVRLWARTIALWDGHLGRVGRADYPWLGQ